MRRMIQGVLLSTVLSLLGGCGSNACDVATDKIKACFQAATCSALKNKNAQTACTTYQQGGMVPANGGCTPDQQALADKVNTCSALDPEQLCIACK